MIFFDIDGTLVDSSFRHTELLSELLKKRSLPIQNHLMDGYLNYKADGNNTMSFLERVLRIERKTASEIYAEWRRRIEDRKLLETDCVYDDAVCVLQELNRRNEDIYYLSSRSAPDSLLLELEDLDIYRYAREICVVSPLDGAAGKTLAIKRILSDYPDCTAVMVGDSEIDYRSAVDTGIDYYILHRGFRSKKYWEQKGVSTHPDLYALLNCLP